MEPSAQHEELQEKIDLAVEMGRDDLAEAAIAAQLDLEGAFPLLEGAIKDAMAEEKELERYITVLQSRRAS